MAKVVGGFASSHTPLMYMEGKDWGKRGEQDRRNRELIKMPEGKRVTYDELEALADPAIKKQINEETFIRKEAAIQKGLDELERRFVQTNPDVVVMFGDDQSEWFFDENMPSINVFWGDKIHILPRGESGPLRSYITEEMDFPVQRDLGLHIIEHLMEREFDVSHSQYQAEKYGGKIGPATWYLDMERETEPRPFGIPHAFGFAMGRWFGGKVVPIVPISINTCYPPNWISPKRAYSLGKAVREAVDKWDSGLRVAMACSGGLSHFVVDEELDRLSLKGLTEGNGELLASLPRHRLQSATTETLNWVATAGAMNGTPMEQITYEPGYRSLAGTGCGCAVGAWEK
jgi:3-O-methylgallate 3,4-dioxygenase